MARTIRFRFLIDGGLGRGRLLFADNRLPPDNVAIALEHAGLLRLGCILGFVGQGQGERGQDEEFKHDSLRLE
jgi:hypothetical protein